MTSLRLFEGLFANPNDVGETNTLILLNVYILYSRIDVIHSIYMLEILKKETPYRANEAF